MQVTIGGDWSYQDQLDGRTLAEAERVRVRWPDGSVTEHVCTVREYSAPMMEMGHATQIPIVEAYITIEHRGCSVPVRLGRSALDVERL